ncbi:MAG: winged helix-turn-helix transcriptional regulator [Rhodospirillales bacterium]|nr:winged helix-turn-helix transcriptional regulator [Rhodospirillales bacterium]
MDVKKVESNVQAAASLLKSLSNEKRLMIVCALHKGEKSVGELEEIVELSQSALSQHLARLRHDGLVSTRRNAQTIYYSIKDSAVESLLKSLCSIYGPNPTSPKE